MQKFLYVLLVTIFGVSLVAGNGFALVLKNECLMTEDYNAFFPSEFHAGTLLSSDSNNSYPDELAYIPSSGAAFWLWYEKSQGGEPIQPGTAFAGLIPLPGQEPGLSAAGILSSPSNHVEGSRYAPVPEPATMLLLGTGLLGLALIGRVKFIKK